MEAPVVAAIIAGSVATLASIGTLVTSLVTFRQTKRHNFDTLNEARRIKRKGEIEKALYEFYGPVHAHLQVSKALSRLLFAEKPKDFMTLTYLLEPAQKYTTESGAEVQVNLSDDDKKLLDEIIEITRKIEELIVTKGGLVDDRTLMFDYVPDPNITKFPGVKDVGLLYLAVAHFRVLRLAYEGQLKGEVKRYENYVFPKELPGKITQRIEALQSELTKLNK